MMHTARNWMIAGLAAGALAWGGVAAWPRAVSAAQWEPYTGNPLLQYFMGFHGTLSFSSQVDRNSGEWRIQLWPNTPSASVTMNVLHVGTGLSIDQVIALSYWPTDVEPSPDGAGFWVAGKRRTGNTVLEYFALGDPALGTDPFGEMRVEPAQVQSITSILDRSVEGQDIINAMFPLIGSQPYQLVVQFEDSRDLYTLDGTVESAEPVLLASSEFTRNPPILLDAQPGMCVDFAPRNHVTLGYNYQMNPILGDGPKFILVDGDRDGDIDDVLELSWAEMASLGISRFEMNLGW